MNSINKYSKLFNFLGAWFPDMDIEDITEEEVVEKYKKTIEQDELKSIILDIQNIKIEIDNYWEQVMKETNLFFKNSNEVSEWLDLINQYLEK